MKKKFWEQRFKTKNFPHVNKIRGAHFANLYTLAEGVTILIRSL